MTGLLATAYAAVAAAVLIAVVAVYVGGSYDRDCRAHGRVVVISPRDHSRACLAVEALMPAR